MALESVRAATAVGGLVLGIALLIAGTAGFELTMTATTGGIIMLLSIGWMSYSVGQAEA